MKPLYLRRLTALIGLALAGSEAHGATTWTVTSTGEPASITSASCAGVCTLRDAINAAANGDTIQFAPALDGATIALSLYSNPATGNQFGASAFYLDTKGVIIDATLNGLTQGVVISAQAANAGCWDNCFRLFDIDYFGGLTLNGITLTGGVAGAPGGALGAGGAIFNRGVVVISRGSLVGNSAGSAGGGYGSGLGAAAVAGGGSGVGGYGGHGGSTVAGAGGNPNGGAYGTLSDGGAGGFGGGGGGGGPISPGGAGGFGGSGGGGGGALSLAPAASRGGNGGFGGGGGGGGGNAAAGYAERLNISDGGSGGFGGGAAGSGYKYNSTSNSDRGGAPGGGAGMGGAIFNDAGFVTLTNVTFNNNIAFGGKVSSVGSDIGGPGHDGSGLGGALFNYTGSMTLNYVTLVGNSAIRGTPEGSAIYSLGDGHCSDGGNVWCGSGISKASLTLNRTIVGAGTGGTHAVVIDQINQGSIANLSTSSGPYNLVASKIAMNGTSFGAGVLTAAAPNLAALPSTLHGGLVDILTPNSGSPVINAVSCAAPLVDQRGAARPDPASAGLATPCDIGAVEAANLYTITSTASPLAGGTVSCIPETVNSGGSSTCTASANPGYTFSAFSGDCTGSTCELTNIHASKNVTGTFTLAPLVPPTITKLFGTASLQVSHITQLTFTLSNPNALGSLTGVAFTDSLPAGLVVATPSGLTSNCGGTATAVAGATSASLSGATMAADTSCTMSVSVQATTPGVKNNSVQVTSTNGGVGNTSNAALSVPAGVPPTITNVFGALKIPLGSTTSLTFTVKNPNAVASLTGVAFTDSLPAGLVVATPNGLTSNCGGTVTAVAGASSASLSGATLAANASCTVAVGVTGTTPGSKDNSVQPTSTNAGNGNPSHAILTVLTCWDNDTIACDGFEPATIFTLGSGFSNPTGVAVDASGNVFVADRGNNAVKEILAAGGYTTVNTLWSGVGYPFGIAVDASGNVFVTDTYDNTVKEILAPGYTTVTTLGSGFNLPSGVAVHASGNVFVADTYNNAVKEILAAGGYTTVNTLGSEFYVPYGVAVHASGNVFVADLGNNAMKEILAPDYATINTRIGFNNPTGVAVDASGNVFVADNGNNAVKKILAAGGYTTLITLGSGFLYPSGVAVDASGNVFVADSGNNAVKMILVPGGHP